MIPRDTFGAAVVSASSSWAAIGLIVSGLALGSTPDALWWGLGGLLLVIGLVLLVGEVVRAYRIRKRHGVTPATSSTRRYIATALALAVPPSAGLGMGMDPAFAGLVLVPLVLWGGYGGVLRLPAWAQVVSFASALAVLLGILVACGDIVEGLSLAGQASIVAFITIAVLAVVVELMGRAANRPPSP